MAEVQSTPGVNPEKADEAYQELVSVLQKHRLTVGELLIVLSNIVYTVGASIGGYKTPGPSVEELNKLYYSEPHRVEIALMLQGLLMSTWVESYLKLQSPPNP